ncbi:MAG: hypothetical protein ACRD2I_17330, partial [Vicinamibacterales bacterium]
QSAICNLQSFLSFRKPWLTEVGGFRASGMIVHQVGKTGDDQHRRQAGGNHEQAPGSKVTQVEFVEFPRFWQSLQPDPESELGCIVSGQTNLLLSANSALNKCFAHRC